MNKYEIRTRNIDFGIESSTFIEAVSESSALMVFNSRKSPYIEAISVPMIVRPIDEEFPLPVATEKALTVYAVYGTYDDFGDVGQWLVATYFSEDHAKARCDRENRIDMMREDNRNGSYPFIVESVEVV